MLNEATKDNLRRKSAYIDVVQHHGGLPLFSWLDINITELCNRKCAFCPRVDEEAYPNQNLNMSIELAKKIGDELLAIDYRGVVVFSGYSEPTLHPHFEEIVAAFPKQVRLEMITNGDNLTPERFRRMYDAGIDFVVVSMYDGPHQVDEFHHIFAEARISRDDYLLRDRWHTDADSFGLKLTNRAGTIHVGSQPELLPNHPCYYTAYSMTIDWNGDVLLCMQDWNKKIKTGNLASQSLLDIWQGKMLSKVRNRLIKGNRGFIPCNQCNTDGTLHGYNHAAEWLEGKK